MSPKVVLGVPTQIGCHVSVLRCLSERGGYGDIMVIETRWMVVEICLFVSNEPLINPENGGSGAGIIDLSWLLPIFSMLY